MHVRVGLMGLMSALAMTSLAGCGAETPKAAAPTASTPTAAATQAATAAATAATSTASAAASAPTLRTAKAGGADVLVDAKGLTLYTFKNDEAAPGKSVCNGGCATTWPPVIVASTATKDAALTGEVGTVTRDDGTKQATYRGKPLYRFAADTAPGESKGAAIANWALATPSGGATSGTSGGSAPTASVTAASGSSEYNY